MAWGFFWKEPWGFPAIRSRSGKATEIAQKKKKTWPLSAVTLHLTINYEWSGKLEYLSEKKYFPTSYFNKQLSVFYWWPTIPQLIWSYTAMLLTRTSEKRWKNFKFWERTSRWAMMTVSGCEGNIQQTPKIWFWQVKEDWFRRTSCTHGDRCKVSTSLTHHNYSIWSKFTPASHLNWTSHSKWVQPETP